MTKSQLERVHRYWSMGLKYEDIALLVGMSLSWVKVCHRKSPQLRAYYQAVRESRDYDLVQWGGNKRVIRLKY